MTRRIAAACALAVACAHPAGIARLTQLDASDCAGGQDDTTAVQAAMTAGTCLAPGTYNVDMAPYGATGRRRDAMLAGGTLCGVREAMTTVRFRGDARKLLWYGVRNATIRGVTLDSTCVSDTAEQTHLVRVDAAGPTVTDATLVHPQRATPVGDSVNVVGSPSAPVTGLEVRHVAFAACGRFGLQLTRSTHDAVVADNSFGDGCALGSEGSGDLAGITVTHNTFTGTSRSLAVEIERMTGLTFDHNRVVGHGVFVTYCDGCRFEHNSVTGMSPALVGDFASALRVATSAHHLVVADNVFEQGPTAPAVLVSPIRTNFQADLADVQITDNTVVQAAAAPFVVIRGVAGFAAHRNVLRYAGPASYTPTVLDAAPSDATSPATSVPCSDVQDDDAVAP